MPDSHETHLDDDGTTAFGEMNAHIHTGFPCVCVCIHVYAHNVYVLVCTYLRICTQSLGGCACTHVYTHRICICLCSYINIGTQSLHVLVCIFAYMYTEFTWICVNGRIVSAFTHVRGTG